MKNAPPGSLLNRVRERMAALERMEQAPAAEARLMEFCRQAWPVLEPATPYIPGWHLEAVCEHLEAVCEGQILRLVINMPPRHMKSLAVSVFWPAWVWTRHPERRFLFASYARALAVRDSLKCRRLIGGVWYQNCWGRRFALCADQNARERFENDRTGFRLATSVGGQVTGEGGDYVIADDPHNAREAQSDKKRRNVLEWWDQAMSTRCNNPQTGAHVIVMQRLHERDLSGHVLEQGGYVHLVLPASWEGRRIFSTAPHNLGLRVEDPRTEPDAPLWPQRFDKRSLARLALALGSYGAAGQLQQRPAPVSGGIFKLHWWRRCTGAPDVGLTVQSWDTAFKTGANNAYSVGQTWRAATNGYYLLDQRRERLEYPELRRLLIELYEQWKPDVVLVEDKASGQSLVQELKRSTRLPLLAVRVVDGDKALRAHAVSPFVESGKVFLPHKAPWLDAFLDELTRFPNSAYADQTDALTQALQYMQAKARFRTSGQQHWN